MTIDWELSETEQENISKEFQRLKGKYIHIKNKSK